MRKIFSHWRQSICGWAHRGPTCSFLFLWLQVAVQTSTLLQQSFVIIRLWMWRFTVEEDDTMRPDGAAWELRARFRSNNSYFKPIQTHPCESVSTDSSNAVLLLQFVFVCRLFQLYCCVVPLLVLPLIFHCLGITKTCLFKYTENFPTKNWKFSDKKYWYFSYFCSKHRLWVLVRTASPRRF